MSKSRTLSVCISDVPKNRFFKHSNGKIYLNLTTYDYDQKNEYNEDFSVSLPLTEREKAQKKNDPNFKVDRVFCGNGRIWGENPVTEKEAMPWDDLQTEDSPATDLDADKTVFDD